MRDIIEVLTRLEALARIHAVTRAQANAAKRYVCEHAGEFMTDEHWPAPVGELARRAVRAVGVGA